MKRKVPSKILLIVYVSLLVGCATPARYDGMIPETRSIRSVSEKFFLKNAITLTDVSGGEATMPWHTSEVGAPAFKKALKESLKMTQLLAPASSRGEYELSVDLESVDQPFMGASMSVTSAANYLLINNATHDVTFDQRIEATYRAKFGDAILGMKRLRLANEGSIKKNIRIFLERLLSLK